MEKENRCKTAFSSNYILSWFNQIQFKFINTNAFVEKYGVIIHGRNGLYVIYYFNDILIISESVNY